MEQNAKSCCGSHNCKAWALLALRIAIGVIFINHGWGKLFGTAPGMAAFRGMVAAIGFPMPTLFAYAAALSEFLGGIALLLGVWTRLFSVLIGIVMLVALVIVKKFSLPVADVDLALLAITIALFLLGPGAYSVSRYMKSSEAGGDQAPCCNSTQQKT